MESAGLPTTIPSTNRTDTEPTATKESVHNGVTMCTRCAKVMVGCFLPFLIACLFPAVYDIKTGKVKSACKG